MAQAGRFALAGACKRGELSFSSVDTIADRWSHFAAYAKSEGIGRMERITPELVQSYGRALAQQVQEQKLTPAYAQNMVSAVNTVLHQVRDWKSVSPTKACGIPERSSVRQTAPIGVTRQSEFSRALNALREVGQERGASVAELAREFGLRSKEASLLDAAKAAQQARLTGAIRIIEGTKGGMARTIPITRPEQLSALSRAAAVQGEGRSLIPAEQNWRQWREGDLRAVRETLQTHGIARLHDLRAAYAVDRYKQITGSDAPVMGGKNADRNSDREARQTISAELGHNRIEVAAAYIGGR